MHEGHSFSERTKRVSKAFWLRCCVMSTAIKQDKIVLSVGDNAARALRALDKDSMSPNI